jgi:threonine aldolase
MPGCMSMVLLGCGQRRHPPQRTCRHAAHFAEGLRAAGYTVLNEVVLNQVLVTFGDAERTRRVIADIQQDGTCWCGETVWQGHTAMRISVSSWATTEADVERSLQAMIRVAHERAESRGIYPVELESFHQVEGKTAD